MRFDRRSIVSGLVFSIVACAGPEGPAGPAGPEGPQGPQGVPGLSNSAQSAGLISAAGTVAVVLSQVPATARPVLSCYITDELTPPVAWLPVSDGNGNSTACGLVLSNNQWSAVMINGPSLWFYYLVVTW